MNYINNLFFELIQVAIGTRICLSHTPSADEWGELYAMAKKQSLVGVCFVGVQKLVDSEKEDYCGMPEMLYFTWMGMAAKIQQRNEVVTKQCAELQAKLVADGFDGCVIKGQAYAALYGDLALLRQSGDIDFWVNADMKKVINYSRVEFDIIEIDYHHVETLVFDDTPVELHYRPSISRNLIRNVRLQKMFEKHKTFDYIDDDSFCFKAPSPIVNVVIALNHSFWHLMYEGVGLRQMMDLYFVLKSYKYDKREMLDCINYLHLYKFTSACMWVMINIFGLEEQYCLCEPDEKSGVFLLNEVMNAGNFGRHDDRIDHTPKTSRPAIFLKWMKYSFMKISQYPVEVLWAPIGIAYISIMSKLRK